ncbi:NAD-dependent epimerase/dehydratase family protein [Paenibacillus sp. NRS-1782]|uniref:NAD-dependent epimerase/dehydratase family protein n=1 Tax=unclassified Paenibacillus TaxID=185978 RepID=UPI003D2BFC9F
MKILITGGAGFIGSTVAEQLLNLGHNVFVIDNLSTGHLSNLDERAVFFEADIKSDQLNNLFNQIKPDQVLHFAAQVNVNRSIEDPLLDEETNIKGTVNILENCKKHGVKKIIYASSAAVYGVPQNLPIAENHTIDPISFYGISKFVPEQYIKTYAALYGFKYTILRYSNVFGPKQDHVGEGGVVSIFINKMLKNESLIIYGNGEQTRDFIYVQDVVNANIAAIDSEINGVFNVSTNTTISLNELVRIMSEFNSKKVELTYQENRVGDIIHSCLDNSSAILHLSWKPKYSLEEALKETFDYYRSEAFNNEFV